MSTKIENIETSFYTPPDIGLEHLLYDLGLIFFHIYKFKGNADIESIKSSYYSIMDRIEKFSFDLVRENNKFVWKKLNERIYSFNSVECKDIESNVRVESEKMRSLQAPISFTILYNESEYCIIQCSRHSYVDARSANTIFNDIMNKADTNRYNMLSSSEAVDIRIKNNCCCACFMHFLNIFSMKKAISDVDNSKTYDMKDALVHPNFEISQQFDKPTFSNVTKNSMICAIIVKSYYNVNVKNGIDPNHQISFGVAIDILPDDRDSVIGNYVSSTIITVNGQSDLKDLAEFINNSIVEEKRKMIDVTTYSLANLAMKNKTFIELKQKSGNTPSPMFSVSNWTNYDIFKNSNIEYYHHYSSIMLGNTNDALASLHIISYQPNNMVRITSISNKCDHNLEVCDNINSIFSKI